MKIKKLIQRAGLNPKDGKRVIAIARNPQVASYPVKFTNHQIRRAKNDPRLWNVYLPSEDEIDAEGETKNNYGEAENTVLPGLQHKYRQTALLTVSGKCVANCRICFRRHTSHESENIIDEWKLGQVIKYLHEHQEINNIVLTGGDPLMVRRAFLEELMGQLSAITHIRWIRIGTKVPVDAPNLITDQLLSLLSDCKKPVILVTHANLPVEIDRQTREAIARIRKAGMAIYHQHAILRGVNDDADTLHELYMRLAETGISNMYTFHAMPVRGASHFQTTFLHAFKVIERAKRKLSGPAKTFRYVIPTKDAKMEVLGFDDEKDPLRMILRYHESRDHDLLGTIREVSVSKDTNWVEL